MSKVSKQSFINATKWTAVGEIFAKVISPITTIVLARILASEVFGVVASITTITALADLLTDAGFNAYIVQNQFHDDEERQQTIEVCFWSNLFLSFTMFSIIFLFRGKFAAFVGAAGYEIPLVVASLVMPLTSFSSIEYAVMQKDFKFKKLAVIKIIGKSIPLIVTVPLALLGLEYWALICGTLIGEIVICALSIAFGGFKPRFRYDFSRLKKIFSFSSWAYLESLLEWTLKNIAIPFVSSVYGLSLLGAFKTGLNLVLQIITAVYSLYGGVFKSSISREQNNKIAFEKIFMLVQKYTSIISIPLGIGVFLFRDALTMILLGEDWGEASIIIGCYGFVGTFSIAFSNFYSDSIRAKGYPKYLVYSDIISLVALVVLLLNISKMSFSCFCIMYAFTKVFQMGGQIAYGKKITGISIGRVLSNCKTSIIAAILMGMIIMVFDLNSGLLEKQIVGILISIIFYFFVYLLFDPDRKQTMKIVGKVVKR